MKKIYLMLTAMAVSSAVFAQNFVKQELTSVVAKDVVLPEFSNAAGTPDDTLGFDELGVQLIQYGSDAGYVFGTNTIAFPAPNEGNFQWNLEYARSFPVQDPQVVIGAGFIFGYKNDVSGSPAAATVKLYDLKQDVALSVLALPPAFDADGPGSNVLASGDLNFADADTMFPAITWVNFDADGWVASDFVIGLDITSLYGTPSDTLVLMADAHNDSDGTSTFTRFAQGTAIGGQSLWARSTALLQGDLFVNLAIFAVVAESEVGIEEQGFVNGVKMTTYPNPATIGENITVQYGLESNAKNVSFRIVSATGQVFSTVYEGEKRSGLHQTTIPTGNLASGSYIYLLEADGKRLAKRLEILK